jgi:hypothetical protein
VLLAAAVAGGAACAGARPGRAQMQAVPFTTPAVTIVLPPKLMAAHPATLAVFGVDGKLAPGISVDLSDGESVTTDRTGRAHFTAPAKATFLLAHAEGTTVAALIDPAAGASEPRAVALPPVVSLRENIWMCAPGLQGDATADTVKINGRAALVAAASPECVVALPPPGTAPGPASISLSAPGVHWTASTTLVSLAFEAPHPALQPGQKGRLTVRVRGSAAKLDLVVENTNPDVLQFVRGDVQEVRTSGGESNSASMEVRAERSGDFSFRARIIPPPDPALAARYLLAAAPYASRKVRSKLEKLARRLAHRPRNVEPERKDIARILNESAPGDFSTLLSAAYSAL